MDLSISKGQVNDVTVLVNNTEVTVQQANNIVVEVSPSPTQYVAIDRGLTGPQGPQGPQGLAGQGVPTGGTVNQILTKQSSVDNDTAWESDATLNFLQLNTASAASIALGKLRWNAATATAAFGIIDGTIECNIGEQMYAYVTNADSATILKGQPVYLYGATGNRASVKLASNLGDPTSAKTLGLATQDIAPNATGFVTTQGVLEKLNTSAFAEGDTLYLGATAGSLTNIKPSAPNHLVYIGVVERANNGNGQIYVRPQNGYELEELHNVQIVNPVNGQTIIYDQIDSLWKNANLTAGSNITITNTAGGIQIAATGGSGTVTAVNATAPINSTGGSAPVISMPAATASVDGYLTSTDWNTFNNKTSNTGTVTSVNGTGTVSGINLSGTVTSSGNLTLGGSLDLSAPPTIGNTTPNTGKFSTLESTGTSNLGTGFANYVVVNGAASGGVPSISMTGSDATVGGFVTVKGAGAFSFFNNSASSSRMFRIDGSASTSLANYLQASGSVTTVAPVLSAQGSDTNIPLVIQPKGTGALQAQQTDSTTTGGNARGANAVDFQMARGAASGVASGSYSFIGNGFGNRAGTYSGAIAGGTNNTATSNFAFIGAGAANTVSLTQYGAIVGGNINTANGHYNFIGGGYTNSGTSGTAVTTQATTTVTIGSTAVTLSASNAAIKIGQYVSGTGIAGETYVATISGTSLTLSQNASASGSPTLSFFTPHGVVVGGGNNQATGSYSFIGGGGDAGTAGNRNVASGDWSTVGGGVKNVASGIGSVVAGGGFDGTTIVGNTASGTTSVVSGGTVNTASGLVSVVGGGNNNLASGNRSFIGGGAQGTTRTIIGNHVFPACSIPISAGVVGSSQAGLLVLGRETTDATATALASNSSAIGTTNQVILPNNSAYYFKGSVIAGVTAGGNTKAWSFEGAIKRGATAGSTALVGTPAVNTVASDAGASTWAVALTADTTNGGLTVTVTGQAATTIRWVAKIETSEMTF